MIRDHGNSKTVGIRCYDSNGDLREEYLSSLLPEYQRLNEEIKAANQEDGGWDTMAEDGTSYRIKKAGSPLLLAKTKQGEETETYNLQLILDDYLQNSQGN